MLVEIDKVVVQDRIRKDFGNIDELAQDIKENGLINPPVVTPEFELIAGERRYRAMKSLGWQQIEVRVMSVQDALHKLKLEISENENRKDFSFNEKMTWAELLKEEYGKIAKENMSEGGQGRQISDTLRTDSLVAKEVGLGSRDTYRKAQYIYENADEEMIKQLDDGKLSINGAYVSLKNKAKQLEEEKENLKNKTLQLESEKQRLQSELQQEKNKPIKTETKVVDNTDYGLKDKAKRLEQQVLSKDKEYQKLHSEYLQKTREVNEAKKQIEALKQTKEEKRYTEELEQNTLLFCTKVEKFIKEVGGLAYLSNHINELSSPSQQAYIKCVELINAWGQNVLANTNKN